MDTMYKMKQGDVARIIKLNTDNEMRQRLMELGLIEGTKVECLHKSLFGDSCAFLVRGAIIALRSEVSNFILMSSDL